MANKRKTQAAEHHLGIKVEPGELRDLDLAPGMQAPGPEGWWVRYGHDRGGKWFATEAAALKELKHFVGRRFTERERETRALEALLAHANERLAQLASKP